MSDSSIEQRVFARKASGLVRVIGPYAATAFAALNTSPSYSGTISLSWIPFQWPGVNAFWILFLGIWLAGIQGINYAMIGTLTPRSGADYVFGSRLWRPDIIFGVYMAFIVWSGVTAGLECSLNAAFIQVPLYIFGTIYNIPALISAGTWLVSAAGYWTVGIVSAIGLFILMIMPTKVIVNFMNLAFTLSIPMYAIIFLSLGLATPASFMANWNSFLGSSNFQGVISTAQAQGLTFIRDPVGLTYGLAASTLASYWVYYGWNMPVIFAGEVKDVSRSLMIATWGSLFITGFYFCGETLLMYRLTSPDWIAAEAYLGTNSLSAGTYVGQTAVPFVSFYAAVALPNPLLIGFVSVVEVIDEIALPAVYWFYSSRTLFAMAFDRVLPEKIAYVHPKLRSPMLTMIIMFILAFPGIALQAGIVAIPINFIWVAVLLWTFIALSCFRLKKKMPDVWETCPAWFKRKFLGVSTFAWVAGVTFVILAWNLVGDFFVPAVGGPLTWETAAETFVIIIIGLVYWHLRRRQIKNKEGFDLMETFNIVPPA
jgi:amino acid transporter